jgi:hypothetical protein
MSETEAYEEEYSPDTEPKASKGWLDLIANGEKAFAEWQLKCDNIDKLYANLGKLASTVREREFQLFWANIQVLGPSIYSRPPVPVVVPRFKDRRPVARTSSELLERVSIVTLEMQDIDSIMIDIRNDLTAVSRGQAWITTDDDGECCIECCIEWVDRKDFLHDPARTWKEVDWVDKISWLTKGEARKRFYKTSGNAYKDAAYVKRKAEETGYDETDTRLKAPFHELWCKSANKVVWVAEGCEKVLDEGRPHLELEGFFPCPKPAYGTLQRGTLIPVPDILFYKDQLEEINEITGRIAALTESLRLKGFYPAGNGQASDAIEAAIKNTSNNQVLVPIANWAAMGNGDPKDMILWLPIDQVAAVITGLIELRKQLIDDVYQITGLSDIMRGSTVASETLGAQKLKSQYGSVRIRDRQAEMVRIARDITRICAEIMSEGYSAKTMTDMAQMQLPTDADIKRQLMELQQVKGQIESAAAQAKQDPNIQAQIQQNPEQAQKIMQQVQEQLQGLDKQIKDAGETVTIDACMKFLRDNRMRAFTLDIETDSTIQPDEDAQKQRATEYLTAMAGIFQQAVPAVLEVPQMAPLMSEVILFANKQFRIGRSMETTVEEFADQMKQMASQPKADPAAAQAQADQAKAKHDMEMQQMAEQTKQGELQATAQREQIKAQGDAQAAQQAHEADLAQKQVDGETKQLEIIKGYELKTFISGQEAALKEKLAFADIGLKAQKELMNAEEAAEKQAEKAQSDGEARETDAKTVADLSVLGESIMKMGEAVVASAMTKRRVTTPEGREFVMEAVQ